MGIVREEISASSVFPPLQPPKRYLFGPGPTMVHPRVYQALSKPIVGHLDPYFFQVLSDVQQLLILTFGTKDGTTMVISGTEAMVVPQPLAARTCLEPHAPSADGQGGIR